MLRRAASHARRGARSSEGACGSLCTGATFELELTYEVDGATVTVTETGDYGCVH